MRCDTDKVVQALMVSVTVKDAIEVPPWKSKVPTLSSAVEVSLCAPVNRDKDGSEQM